LLLLDEVEELLDELEDFDFDGILRGKSDSTDFDRLLLGDPDCERLFRRESESTDLDFEWVRCDELESTDIDFEWLCLGDLE
jgi:hypothetical protein